MILSILICSLVARKQSLKKLEDYLRKQIGNRIEEVEIITYIDNRQKSTGFKRNWLLQQAHGKYIVFVDDDDWVADYYINEMLIACASDCDCFAINGIMTTNGKHETKWLLSKDYENKDVVENGVMVYYRHTNHITGVKRSIALAAGFPDKSNAEDKWYSDRLVLKTEFTITKPMYTYRFSTLNKQYK